MLTRVATLRVVLLRLQYHKAPVSLRLCFPLDDGKRSDPGSCCSHYSWFEAIPREAACPSLCWAPTMASGTVSPWHRKGPTAPSRGHTQLHRTIHTPPFSVTPLVWDAPRAMPSRAVMVPGRQEHPCAAGTKPLAALPPAGRRPPRASASVGALEQAARPSGAGPFPARAAGAVSPLPCTGHVAALCSSLSVAAGPRGRKGRPGECMGTRCRNKATLAPERSSTVY